MSSTYGDRLKLSIFGQSHGTAIGMTLDEIPAGLPVDLNLLQEFLNRRAPGQYDFTTPRKEEDVPEFLSGIVDGYTCGAPIAAVIYNKNTKSADYDNLKNCPRPGHADLTAQVKYAGYQDIAGGGHFSGRLTAPLCIAGGLCKQWLARKGIQICGHIVSIGGIYDEPKYLNWVDPDFSKLNSTFPVMDPQAKDQMLQAILAAKEDGDSVGGVVECLITGVPAGVGGPMFGGMEGKIAQAIYGIPAVKGLDFGSGFSGSTMRGSENNDAFTIHNDQVQTETNNAGGILGGITTGMPIVFRVAVKPTPSIFKAQQTVNLTNMDISQLNLKGRHDPCIVPRIVPVVEAAAAIALFDALL